MTGFQKAIKYAALAFAIFLSVSIIGGILSFFSVFFDGDVKGEMKTYTLSDKITELDIEIAAADFTVKTGESFCVKSNLKYLTVEEKDGKLVIEEKKKLLRYYSGVKLELYIPENTVFEKADITTGAGVVTLNGLSADTLVMELGAGKVDIKGLIVTKRADIDGGAGQIVIENGSLSNLKLNMGVGELRLAGKLAGDCELDCGVGAARLMLSGKKDDYCIKVNKGIGEATVDGEKVQDGFVSGNGGNEINIDGGIGEIKVSFEN